MTRTLIAGFGNVLRRDDGWGVEVVRRLQSHIPEDTANVRLLEVGTGGLHLAQELLAGYDRLIILDAMSLGAAPGEIRVLRIDSVESVNAIDLHLAIPSRALAVAQALGALPNERIIVGCEPADVDELAIGLTDAVQRAVPTAIALIDALLRQPALPVRSAEA